MRGERPDARAVIELDVTNLDLIGEHGRFPILIQARHIDVVLSVRHNRFGVIEGVGKLQRLGHVIERARIISGYE